MKNSCIGESGLWQSCRPFLDYTEVHQRDYEGWTRREVEYRSGNRYWCHEPDDTSVPGPFPDEVDEATESYFGIPSSAPVTVKAVCAYEHMRRHSRYRVCSAREIDNVYPGECITLSCI